MLTPAAAPRGLAQAKVVDDLAAVFRALVVNSLHYLEWPEMLTSVVERIRAMLTPSSCGMHVYIRV